MFHSASLLLVGFLWLSSAGMADDRAALREAGAAIENGNYAAAEQRLRAELRAHPNDADALSLLGVALERQRKPGEAEQAFLRAVEIDPAHADANLQLARLDLKRRDAASALRRLDRLPPSRRDAPDAAVLRMQSLYMTGNTEEADTLFARVSRAAGGDASLALSAGLALANAGRFGRAESLLSNALAAAPGDFRLLYNLGVVATYAGHHERAREVLETARRQQPDNVDVLYSLAYVHEMLRRREPAVELLAQAAKLAPQRADIQKLLAVATTELRAWGDAVEAWERYLKLQPDDDFARRERGFTMARTGKLEEGIADLKWFLARHPQDADGHFELGLVESESDPESGLAHLNRAVDLKPDLVEARAARGSLYYQQGKPEAAVLDLEFAAARQPENAVVLDRLGQTYVALDRLPDALRVLRRAAGLATTDSRTQLHFARALADAGETGESKVVMDRFRQLGPTAKNTVPEGLVEYLSLTPEQRRADYRARVEKAVGEHPEDAGAQVRYLKLLLEDGDSGKAGTVARRLAALKPGAETLADAGRALLEARQYAPARDLLESAAASGAGAPVQLALAVATFHAAGASEGLARLDRMPENGRDGEYYLARAEMLDVLGKGADAVAAVEAALRDAPARPGFYQQAAWLLMRNGRSNAALEMLERVVKAQPQSREILVIQAGALEVAGQSDEAERLLAQIRKRWPEWQAGWVASGIVMARRRQFVEARETLETAAALGARSAEARFYLADCTLRSAPDHVEAAEETAREAIRLAPDEWWTAELAGRIALQKRDAATAAREFREALRLRPGLVQAHQGLAQALAALGRAVEAEAERKQAQAALITSDAADGPDPARFFLLKPPREW